MKTASILKQIFQALFILKINLFQFIVLSISIAHQVGLQYLFNHNLGFSSPQEDARQKYVELVSSLVSESSSQVKDTTAERKGGYETIELTTKDNITKIMLNRPEKKNAINEQVRRLAFRVKIFTVR